MSALRTVFYVGVAFGLFVWFNAQRQPEGPKVHLVMHNAISPVEAFNPVDAVMAVE